MPALPPAGEGTVYSVQIDLVPDKLVYAAGEPVHMQLVLTNTSQGKVKSVVISQPAIDLVAAGVFAHPLPPNAPSTQVGNPVKTFPAGNDQTRLAVGEKVSYDLTWDQRDVDGKQVAPGWYYYESDYFFREESLDEPVHGGLRNRAFLIQYPQGAMQRTILVNQSRMVGKTDLGDVVMTLQRIELNEMGASFYVEISSPNDAASTDGRPDWVGRVFPSSAQYVIDGVVKEARAPGNQFLENAVHLRWGASPDQDNYLDPVPVDARELTFVIPELGTDWKGPWEFKIPLG